MYNNNIKKRFQLGFILLFSCPSFNPWFIYLFLLLDSQRSKGSFFFWCVWQSYDGSVSHAAPISLFLVWEWDPPTYMGFTCTNLIKAGEKKKKKYNNSINLVNEIWNIIYRAFLLRRLPEFLCHPRPPKSFTIIWISENSCRFWPISRLNLPKVVFVLMEYVSRWCSNPAQSSLHYEVELGYIGLSRSLGLAEAALDQRKLV